MKKAFANTMEGVKNDLTVDNPRFYHFLMIFACIGISAVLSIYFGFFAWVALVLCVLAIVLSKGGQTVYVLAFLWPLSDVVFILGERLFVIVLITAPVWMALGYIIRLIKRQEKIMLGHALFAGAISLYILILFFVHSLTFTYLGIHIQLVGFIIFLYLVYIFRKDIHLKELFIVLFLGLMVSLLGGLLPNAVIGSCIPGRYAGLRVDPNYFASDFVIAIAILFVLRINGVFRYLFYPVFALLVIAILPTGSKSYLLLLFVLVLVYVLLEIVKHRSQAKKTVLHIFTTVGIVAFLCLLFLENVQFIFERLGADYTNIVESDTVERSALFNFINNITSGRLEIWLIYFEAIFASVGAALFGHGICAPNIGRFLGNTELAPHSIYVDMLYHIGIFGFMLYVAWGLFLLLPFIKQKKVNWWNTLAFVAFAICIGSLSDYRIMLTVYIMLISFVVTYSGEVKKH